MDKIEKDEIRIKTCYSQKLINTVEQIHEEQFSMIVEDHGSIINLEERCIRRFTYPQEFILLIEDSGFFEFVGWWNNWSLSQPLEQTADISRPIILVRRI